MNKIVFQLWEESERGRSCRPDGCSIHIDSAERDRYVESIYSSRRGDSVPDEYERILGYPVDALVEDALFALLKEEKTIRIEEHSFRNLLGMDEIVVRDE